MNAVSLPKTPLSQMRSSSSRLPVFLRKYLFLVGLAVCGHIWFPSNDGNGRAAGERRRRARDGRGAFATSVVEEELKIYEEFNDNNDREEKVREGGGWGDDVNIKALQPISSGNCCIPAALKQIKYGTDLDCFGTCYTKCACGDMVYPFNYVKEKKLFPLIQLTEEDIHKLRFECMSPEKLTPPVKWCQKPHRDTEKGTPMHLVKGIPPTGCSNFTSIGCSGAFQHVIIFPSVKLAFCGIPKVGITMWEQFLRFYIGAKDYSSNPHTKINRRPLYFDKLNPDAQQRIWANDEWTWAAFVQNPAERLLSGYLDKVKTNKLVKGNFSFEAFIDSLSKPANFVTVFDDTGSQVISHKCAIENNSSLFGLTWCSDPRE